MDRNALKFLIELDSKQHKQVSVKILKLLQNPAPHDRVLLEGCDDVWRTDIGERRIIYRYTDDIVQVLAIGKRNDDEIYRDFDRTH